MIETFIFVIIVMLNIALNAKTMQSKTKNARAKSASFVKMQSQIKRN